MAQREAFDRLSYPAPGPISDQARGRITQDINLNKRLGSMRKSYETWAMANATFAMLECLAPLRYLGGLGWVAPFLLSLSCFFQVIFGVFALRIPIRMPIAGLAVAVFAVWTTVTTLLMNGQIGRSFGVGAWDWHNLWLYHYMIFFIAMDFGHMSGDRLRKWIINIMLVGFATSAVIGWLQVVRVPFAMALSMSGFFGGIFRPTGLSNYSFELGYQATIGLSLIGARLINRPLKLWEYVVAGAFIFTILIAQYRTCYISGIGFVGGILLLMQLKKNPTIGLSAGMVGAALIIVPLILFPEKFAYGLRGIDLNDDSVAARELAWRQLAPILEYRPWTGIGSDPNLMVTTNFRVVDKWGSLVLDNFYRMLLACFGYPGLFLGIAGLVVIGIGLYFRMMDENPRVKELSFAGLLVLGSLMIVNLSGNGLVYNTVGLPFIMLMVVGSRNASEEKTIQDPSKFYRVLRKLRIKLG